jgi:hypothetical protein
LCLTSADFDAKYTLKLVTRYTAQTISVGAVISIAEGAHSLANSVMKPVSAIASLTSSLYEYLTEGIGEHHVPALIVIENVANGAAQTVAGIHIICVTDRTEGNTNSI